MPGPLHELAVSLIRSEFPGAETRGFMRAVRQVLGEGARCGDNECRCGKVHWDLVPTFDHGVVPDAYLVDREKKAVTAFEVEDKSTLGAFKMDSYCDIFRALDGDDWFLFIDVRDKWGKRLALIDMDDFEFRRSQQRFEENRRIEEQSVAARFGNLRPVG